MIWELWIEICELRFRSSVVWWINITNLLLDCKGEIVTCLKFEVRSCTMLMSDRARHTEHSRSARADSQMPCFMSRLRSTWPARASGLKSSHLISSCLCLTVVRGCNLSILISFRWLRLRSVTSIVLTLSTPFRISDFSIRISFRWFRLRSVTSIVLTPSTPFRI